MNTYYDYSIYVSLVVAITDIPTVWVSLVTSWFSDTVGLFVVSKDLGRDFLVDVGCRVWNKPVLPRPKTQRGLSLGRLKDGSV